MPLSNIESANGVRVSLGKRRLLQPILIGMFCLATYFFLTTLKQNVSLLYFMFCVFGVYWRNSLGAGEGLGPPKSCGNWCKYYSIRPKLLIFLSTFNFLSLSFFSFNHNYFCLLYITLDEIYTNETTVKT